MLLNEISPDRIRLSFNDADADLEVELKRGKGFFLMYRQGTDLGKLTDDPTVQARMAKIKRKLHGLGPYPTYRGAARVSNWFGDDDINFDIKYGTFDGTYLTPEKAPED